MTRTATIVAAATLLASPARAVDCLADYAALPLAERPTWCQTTGGGSALTQPGGMTWWAAPMTFIANGTATSLLTLDSNLGTVLQTTTGVGAITNRPTPVKFSNGVKAAFVANNTGYVFRINPDTGACVWKTFIGRTSAAGATINFPTGDGTCPGSVTAACSGDQAVAQPTVRFNVVGGAYVESGSIVYAPTRYATTGPGCGTTTRNRIYALDAVTGAPVWVFNRFASPNDYNNPAATVLPPYNLSFISGAVLPDVWDDACGAAGIRDVIYAGSTTATTQSTLWAINANSGALVWSTTVGGLVTAPVLSYNSALCERLYVGTDASSTTAANKSRLKSIGLTSTVCGVNPVPCTLWTSGTTGNAAFNSAVTLNFSAVNAGAHAGKIVVTSNKTLTIVQDNGATSADVCTYAPGTAQAVRSMPYLFPAQGKAYVGRADGLVAQVALDSTCATGVVTRTLLDGTMAGDVYLDADPTFATRWLVVGNDSGRVTRFNIPW
ncbi:MAG: hypothetical protein AABZ30_11380 [Myxococcota bacterium]